MNRKLITYLDVVEAVNSVTNAILEDHGSYPVAMEDDEGPSPASSESHPHSGAD